MNHSNGENNRVKRGPIGKKKKRQKPIFKFSQPVGLEGTFLLLKTGSVDIQFKSFYWA